MTPELAKALLAIDRQDDIERLRTTARDLLKTVALITKRESGNYAVMVGGCEVASGTKEWCIGFAEAREQYGRDVGPCTVVCGEFQVWPDWGSPT